MVEEKPGPHEKLLNFAEFYYGLANLSGRELLLVISERDPEFTWNVDTVTEPMDTLEGLLTVYGKWGVNKIRESSAGDWQDVKLAYAGDPKYYLLAKEWRGNSMLWDLFNNFVNT